MSTKQRILIADDDANIAELVALYLTKEGYDTQKARDGREALSMFRSYSPDLIILDIALPDGNGFDLYRYQKRLSRT